MVNEEGGVAANGLEAEGLSWLPNVSMWIPFGAEATARKTRLPFLIFRAPT
jgi:hypothetical protein